MATSLAHICYALATGRKQSFKQFERSSQYDTGIGRFVSILTKAARSIQAFKTLGSLIQQYNGLKAEVNMHIPNSERAHLDDLLESAPTINQDSVDQKIQDLFNDIKRFTSAFNTERMQYNDKIKAEIPNEYAQFGQFSRKELLEKISTLYVDKSLSDLFSGIKYNDYSTTALFLFYSQLNPQDLPKTTSDIKTLLDAAQIRANQLPQLDVPQLQLSSDPHLADNTQQYQKTNESLSLMNQKFSTSHGETNEFVLPHQPEPNHPRLEL